MFKAKVVYDNGCVYPEPKFRQEVWAAVARLIQLALVILLYPQSLKAMNEVMNE